MTENGGAAPLEGPRLEDGATETSYSETRYQSKRYGLLDRP